MDTLTHARGRLFTGSPNPIDVHVGARIRQRRTLIGMSQEKLGEALGLSFQQVQKYERGANRCGASRLWDLGQVLRVAVSYFFEEMPATVAANSPRLLDGDAPPTQDPGVEDPYAFHLAKRIRKLDPKARSAVTQMVDTLCTLQAAE